VLLATVQCHQWIKSIWICLQSEVWSYSEENWISKESRRSLSVFSTSTWKAITSGDSCWWFSLRWRMKSDRRIFQGETAATNQAYWSRSLHALPRFICIVLW
jgi:hypothetical protein